MTSISLDRPGGPETRTQSNPRRPWRRRPRFREFDAIPSSNDTHLYRRQPCTLIHAPTRADNEKMPAPVVTTRLESPVEAPSEDVYELRSRLQAIAETRDHRSEEVDRLVISPELALVCPELRAVALQLLPNRDPDGFLPKPARTGPQPAPLFTAAREEPVGAADAALAESAHASGPRLIIAAAAYAAKQSLSVAVHAATMLAVIASVIMLIYFARS